MYHYFDRWAHQVKYITVRLTEDQARIIVSDMEDRIKNHIAWLNRYDDPVTEVKLAFRRRLLDKLKQELVET